MESHFLAPIDTLCSINKRYAPACKSTYRTIYSLLEIIYSSLPLLAQTYLQFRVSTLRLELAEFIIIHVVEISILLCMFGNFAYHMFWYSQDEGEEKYVFWKTERDLWERCREYKEKYWGWKWEDIDWDYALLWVLKDPRQEEFFMEMTVAFIETNVF